MITICGPDTDWDDLADYLRDDSWRGAAMRPFFQRLERNQYLPPPTPLPTSWLGRRWNDLRWLFGSPPDPTRGRHGFQGWLRTSVADVSMGLADKQLVKMLKAALKQSQYAGLDRAYTLVRTFLKGQIRRTLDPNHARTQAESPEGVVLVPMSVCGPQTSVHHTADAPLVSRGRRSSPRELLLSVQATHPQNLTIWTDCLVTRVLFDDGAFPRAVGVELRRGKRLYRAHVNPSGEEGTSDKAFAKREVILCGGAFNTPQLLMLSGIGDTIHLDAIAKEASQSKGSESSRQVCCALHDRQGRPIYTQSGGPRRVHSPGVGRNLQDRYEITVISEMKRDFSLLDGAKFALPTGNNPDPHLREWRAAGTGLYASNGAVLGIFKRSRPDLEQPDLFIFGIPLPFEGYKLGYSAVGERHNMFTWAILKGQTRNRDGTVRLLTADPRDTPAINFHYFNETSRPGESDKDPDLVALIDGVKFVRGIAQRAGFYVKDERHPGFREVPADNDALISEWIRSEAWGHHACGTCRMGPDRDERAVLDSRFRVRGVQGLRVVDASIFPQIPGYFIVTNIYMASEKAADVILEDFRSAESDPPIYPLALQTLEAQAVEKRRNALTPPDLRAAAGGKGEAGAGGNPKTAADGNATGGVRERRNALASTLPDPLVAAGGNAVWVDDVTGLALSGGGIRSATLNLGILQALAQKHWLRRMDFLSTVSGGGYIGSFLGRFFDRQRRTRCDDKSLACGGPDKPAEPAPDLVERELNLPDSKILKWLRQHGNYIAPMGDSIWSNIALFVRNLLSVHFVVWVLLFAVFGLASAIRYGLFDPAAAGFGLAVLGTGDMPLGQLVESLLGPFFSPWFMLFELIVLFLVLPRMTGYWIVSQDWHGRYQGPPLTVFFLSVAALLWLAVYKGLALEPLFLALALLSSFVHVELAWRRGRLREEAIGRGSVETQRLRTRNYLTDDLGLAMMTAAVALAFAVVDTLGRGLQQYVAGNQAYIEAFATLIGITMAAIPIARFAANLLAGEKKSGPPSTIARILKQQLFAGAIAVVLLTLPLIALSFATHVVFQGGMAVQAGFWATAFAFLISFILTHPKALTFVNRSSLAQAYAARLARAYLGASNPLRQRAEGANVTEVMACDDVASILDYQPHAAGGPLHLINLTVNQTVDFTSQRGNRDRKGENLAVSCLAMSVGIKAHGRWKSPSDNGRQIPGRKHPSQLSPLGHRPGTEHPLIDITGQPSQRAEMLSLRQWMSLSGAAVGPSRGQTTALGTALLFGLTNLRTGHWWDSGITEAARDGFPQLSALRRLLSLIPEFFRTQFLLISEWIGRYHGPWEQYWNISDGGFFENLGGYELIRRRIPRLIVCDATADPTFEFDGLANLARKIRIDFDAHLQPFTVDELNEYVPAAIRSYLGELAELKPQRDRCADGRDSSLSRKHAALYWVRFGQAGQAPTRPSVLLYIKATMTGDEAADIEQYRAAHPEFPHESTGDQFFDEEQWESYRKLGQHIGSPLFGEDHWFWNIPLKPRAPADPAPFPVPKAPRVG